MLAGLRAPSLEGHHAKVDEPSIRGCWESMNTGCGPCASSRTPGSKAWTRFEPWMTTIVDLDTGQVLSVVDGRDHKGVGDWLFAWPLEWRLAVQVVAIEPSAAFRKALRMWLPRTAVAVDHFHLISLANQAMTGTRQNLSQQVKGRGGRAIDKASAHRMLLLRGGDNLICRAAHRLEEVFAADDPTAILRAVWKSQGTDPRTAPHRFPGSRRGGQACYSRNRSRQPHGRKPTGSIAPSAGGGKKSKYSSSPAPRQARSEPTTPPPRTSSGQRTGT
jgi:hypothetical protein